MKLNGNLIAAVLMLLVFTGMFYLASDWPEKARSFPFLIAIAGMGFSFVLLITELIEIRAAPSTTKEKKGVFPSGATVMILWTALLFSVTIIFGFWVGSMIFMLTFMRVFGHEKWKTSIGITSILVVTLFLALSVAMKISIYGGVLKLTPF